LFSFMIPFWKNAIDDPEKTFPQCFEFIDSNFTTEEEKTKRRSQILDGIRAGYDELLKMTQPILLRGPVAFLILCNNEHGPAFCRALIAVVDESGYLPDPESDAWRKFKDFGEEMKRPADEEKWYDILTQDASDTVHWYRQFFLDWEVVQLDTQT